MSIRLRGFSNRFAFLKNKQANKTAPGYDVTEY